MNLLNCVEEWLFLLLSFSLARVATGTNSIQKAREGFRVIAQRAAVCFDTTQYMREINPLYQTSFSQFRTLFEAAISHSDRSAVKALIDKLTHSAFSATVRSVFERDRLVYSLLLAIEVRLTADSCWICLHIHKTQTQACAHAHTHTHTHTHT